MWLAEVTTNMLTSASNVLVTGIILVSTAYMAVKTPAIWRQYEGVYGQLLVGVPIAGLLFGIAHLGMLTWLPHGLLTILETGGIIGVAAVVVWVGNLHPRMVYSGGEP